ncbi:MAG: WD40 repeat domain-containing protein, partial [Bacteroidetes bacterium]|nr:WD40 repeat domain-containing protein [Bacteroidota bacterium]
MPGFNNPVVKCLSLPDALTRGASVKFLADKTIKLYNDEQALWFNGSGMQIGSVSYSSEKNVMAGASWVNECISPAGNYQADYTNNRIVLRNLNEHKARYFEVKDLRKLSFNRSGTFLLAEFLNEIPRFFSTSDFLERQYLPAGEYAGFPEYVYETRTDRSSEWGLFDSIQNKMPKMPKFLKAAGRFVDVPDPMAGTINILDKMSYEYNRSATNSGTVINLSKKRMISHIRSLIKMSGDIRLSPDSRIMLLNSSKSIALYSIPYGRLLKTMQGNSFENAFSPDSRWLVLYNPLGKLSLINLVTLQETIVPVKLQLSDKNSIRFSADSRYVSVSSGKGGYAVVHLASGAIAMSSETLGYFPTADGRLFTLVDGRAAVARLLRAGDSTQIFSIKLPPKRNKEEMDFNVSYAGNSKAMAFWNGQTAIIMNDYEHPADTTMQHTDGNMFSITAITFSPAGPYLHLQATNNLSIVYNRVSKSGFPTYSSGERQESSLENIGQSLQAISSGNLEAILGSREMAQFSVSGDSVMACLGDSALILRASDGTRLSAWKAPGDIKYFNFRGNLLIAYFNGQLRFYRISDRKEWFSMLPFKNGETVFLLPDGTYMGNRSVARYLGYMSDTRSLSYKQFDYNNNRPDIVLRRLGNADKAYLAIYDSALAIRRRREQLHNAVAINFDKVPELTILNENDIRGEVNEKDLPLKLRINCPGRYPDRLAVYINGNPVGGAKGIRLSRKAFSMDTTIHLLLGEGSNSIEASVFDAAGQESYRRPLYIQCHSDSAFVRKVYFLGIGAQRYHNAGYNLQYARADIAAVIYSL